jgi:hypothetical protein
MGVKEYTEKKECPLKSEDTNWEEKMQVLRFLLKELSIPRFPVLNK